MGVWKGSKIQLSGEQGRMDHYCAGVRALGGEPMAAYCPAPDLSCDGLILCGGGDIAPELFGCSDCGSAPPDRERDSAELELFRAFYQAGKPILGICRGMQLIDVALGGTLIQDLPEQVKPFHGGGDRARVHPLRALEGSLLHRLYGPVFSVNSIHHQAVDQLGEGLRPIAWAESGFIEAFDMPGRPLLGVQFHPERMAFHKFRLDTVDGSHILSWFLAACRGEQNYG